MPGAPGIFRLNHHRERLSQQLFGGVPENPAVFRVHFDEAALLVSDADADRRLGEDECAQVLYKFKLFAGSLQFEQCEAQLEFIGGHRGEVGKHSDFIGGQPPRLGIENRKRAQVEAVTGSQRRARVEPEPWRSCYERVTLEPWVGEGIFDYEGFVAEDSVCAERDRAGHILSFHSDSRFDPLPVAFDEGNQRDRGAKKTGGEAGDPSNAGSGGVSVIAYRCSASRRSVSFFGRGICT
jgi:hypothetical protein